MNPSAILALISDLYGKIAVLQDENHQLKEILNKNVAKDGTPTEQGAAAKPK